jgi:acetyl-CoA synthetase
VAVLLPQTPEAAVTHLACYRIGAVVVPLFTLFGEDGLAFRLADSGARALVTDGANLPKVLAIRDRCPELAEVFSIDQREAGVHGFWQELGKAAMGGPALATAPDDPAFIAYTSGTTGPAEGRAARAPGADRPSAGDRARPRGAGAPGDCLWTPADWAWLGGLTNVLLPGLYHGVPVVAHRMAKFDPERAVDLIARWACATSSCRRPRSS